MGRTERPLDVTAGPVSQLAADLRKLREKAGGLPYRELSRRANYSTGALSDAAGGRKLPSLAVTLAYVAACGGDTHEWEQRWHDTAAELSADGDEPALAEGPSPYVGLAAFGAADADRFFGRDGLVADLCARVAAERFVVVIGPSGSGKSSLLRAGLLHQVRTRGLHGAPGSALMVMTPGPRPLEELAARLAVLLNGTASVLHAELRGDTGSLHLAGLQTMVDRPAEDDLLIVVDQFEELFTLCAEVNERAQFLDLLQAAVTAPNSRIRVVLGVRADFYAQCAQYSQLVKALREAQLLVGPMTTEELRQAITEPAARVGCRVETALVARVVAEATGRPGVLPLVSHALLTTWQRRRGTMLTLAGYEATGGITQAVARTAETTYAALSETQREWTRSLFLRLVALGDGTEDTKRRLDRAELDTDHPDAAVVLERLAQARLITVDHDTIEVTHEALIRCWPRLHEWLTEDRAGLRIHRQLTVATDGWESLEDDSGALYRGARLAIAHDWATTHQSLLSAREKRFLDASRAAEAAEAAIARRRNRRLRQLVALLSVALVLVAGTTVFAITAQRTAVAQRDTATSENVAQEATALRGTDPALAAQLSLAAYRLSPTVGARSSLLSTFALPYSTVLSGNTDSVEAVAYSPKGQVLATSGVDQTVRLWDVTDPHRPSPLAVLHAHTDVVDSVTFSPDGHTMATAGADHTVRLWNVTDPRHPATDSVVHTTDEVSSVVFSPDGRTLADAQDDGKVNLWNVTDLRTPALAGTAAYSSASTVSVAFSPDGRTLATASVDGTARLWNITAPARPVTSAVLTGHADAVNAVAFSPDGRTLATASSDHTVRLWALAGPQPVFLSSLEHDNQVLAVAFSPDGHSLATGNVDHTVRLWDITDLHQPTTLRTLTGHTDEVNSVAFSPDGRTLATASSDHTVWLDDLPGPVLAGHSAIVASAGFSPDGTMAATASGDGTTRLWNVTDPDHPRDLSVMAGPSSTVFSGNALFAEAFSPDGRVLATTSNDAATQLWDITSPGHPVSLAVVTGHTAAVFTTAFSPSGHTLATGSVDGTVRLWDVTNLRHPVTVGVVHNSHADGVISLAFAPDGRTLAAVDASNVRLWDVTDLSRPTQLATLTGHTNAVEAVTFSRDGQLLLSGSDDRTARLWEVTDPRHPVSLATLTGPTDAVDAVAFSPDGHTVAIGSADRNIQLWDITDHARPDLLETLTGHTDAVRSLAFSPDGHTLLSASADDTALLWETDPAQVARRVCALAFPTITASLWDQYFPGMKYQPPCSQT